MAQPDSDRMFNADLHPRVPAGKHGGGEFGKGNGGSKPTPTPHKTAKAAPHKAAAKAPTKPLGPLTSSMSYNAKTGRGPGYGVKGGDPHVHEFQQALNRLGLTDLHGKKLANDGMLGPRTTEAIKAAQRRLGDKADGQMTPKLYKQLLAAKSLPAAKKAEDKRMDVLDSGRAQADMADAATDLPPPAPTQTAMSDQDFEQALMDLLADMPDDELADLAQCADDTQPDAEGSY